MVDELADLRAEIAEIDRQIVELVARRSVFADSLGSLKRKAGSPIRDYRYEKTVVDRARDVARSCGVSEDLAESIMLNLIRASLEVQERGRVEASSAGTGRSALVIGGSGQMGQWFVRFLRSQGFGVTVADPEAGDFPDWREAGGTFDIYIIATPLPIASELLVQMSQSPPDGLIYDIGSLKTPLRTGLNRLVAAGGRVASIHPMFGPETNLLSGRHVVLVDVGVPEATEGARDLFSSTMVTVVEMDLDSHDRLIAYILGLSHALNIAFFTALAESGETAARLGDLSSTTFDRQLEVASLVARENPNLYFEIQYLNEYGTESLTALATAVERLREVVGSGDNQGFAEMMESGASYFDETGLG
jgi:chorismate mutase/prephenate dehydrogenase